MIQTLFELALMAVFAILVIWATIGAARLLLRIYKRCPECGDNNHWWRRRRYLGIRKTSNTGRLWVMNILYCGKGCAISRRKKLILTWMNPTTRRPFLDLVREKYRF